MWTVEEPAADPGPGRPGSTPLVALMAIAAASAALAAVSPARPVGLRPADVLWCALAGAAVPLVASRSRRWPLLGGGAVIAVVGVGGDAVAKLLAVVLLAGLVVVTLSDRRNRLQSAVLGALIVNVALRGPTYGFVGLPTLVVLVALAPMVWSGYRMARRRERRAALALVGALLVVCAIGGVLAAFSALQVRTDLQAGADEATAGLDLLRSGDTVGATARFESASERFHAARGPLDGLTAAAGRVVPIAGQHLEALRTVAASGEALGTSAATTSSTADYRTLTAQGGTVDLSRVLALTGPVTESSAVIDRAFTEVGDVRSPWLVPLVGDELDRFEAKLSDARDEASVAAQALTVAPALLGVDGPTRYLVAFGTPAESRNGGGYVGAYGLLTADDGHLSLDRSGDLNALNPPDPAQPYAFDPPPDWEERYGGYFVQLFLGNSAASPDWPTDRSVLQQLYPQTPGGVAVDGAIYADPTALAGFLSLTGPVTVPGLDITLDAQNAEQFLERDQYVTIDPLNPQRKEILGDVAQATFDALTSRPLPGIGTLTETLGPLVAAGHLRVSVDAPTSEALLDRVGLSGRWAPDPDADLVSVGSADLLSNKIDSYLRREVGVVTTLDPGKGTLHQTVTVTLHNDAPAGGLPDYAIGNDRGLPPGTNVDGLSLRTRHDLQSATVDGQDAPTGRQTELGTNVYSVVVELPPGASRTVVYELDGFVPAWPYRLQVVPQAMANPDVVALEVAGVPGRKESLKVTGPDAEAEVQEFSLATKRAIG